MDRTILATYFNNGIYSFDWLENDKDVEEWLAENKNRYTEIEIIRINVIEEIYESEDME